jgi:hypothetical protein
LCLRTAPFSPLMITTKQCHGWPFLRTLEPLRSRQIWHKPCQSPASLHCLYLDVKTGNLVSSDARNEVSAVGDDKTKARELIASWKEKETVPLDEIRAAQSSQEKGIGGMIIGLVLTM